jgi:hypothetical protein
MKWITCFIGFLIGSTAVNASQPDSLKNVFKGILFETHAPMAAVRAASSPDSLQVIESANAQWLIHRYGGKEVILKETYRQLVSLKRFGFVQVNFARFDSPEEAYAVGEFRAQTAASVFSKGFCGEKDVRDAGYEIWCTNSGGKTGLIIVDGTLCLELFTLKCQGTSLEDMNAVVPELARMVLRKKAKSFR